MLVGGLVGFGAYKMSKSHAQKIEQHTGVAPEELDDAELEKAMDELDIPKQKISEADQEEGAAPAAPAAAPAAASVGASSGGDSDIAELEKLADLHGKGVLSDEEFAAAKKRLLGL